MSIAGNASARMSRTCPPCHACTIASACRRVLFGASIHDTSCPHYRHRPSTPCTAIATAVLPVSPGSRYRNACHAAACAPACSRLAASPRPSLELVVGWRLALGPRPFGILTRGLTYPPRRARRYPACASGMVRALRAWFACCSCCSRLLLLLLSPGACRGLCPSLLFACALAPSCLHVPLRCCRCIGSADVKVSKYSGQQASGVAAYCVYFPSEDDIRLRQTCPSSFPRLSTPCLPHESSLPLPCLPR